MTAAALEPSSRRVRERGILFSASMVRALLAGTKTQTRRVCRSQPKPWRWHHEEGGCSPSDWRAEVCDNGMWDLFSGAAPNQDVPLGYCPYGAPGDRLWVRETWNLGRAMRDCEGIVDDEMLWTAPIPKRDPRGAYLVDDWCLGFAADGGDGPWKPSIFMPRWASRVLLELTDVRVQRVQDISEDDARAEGIEIGEASPLIYERPYALAYAGLWDAINGKRPGCAWADNCWVWCVSFRRLQP